MRPGYVYTEEDWNPVTKETAASGGGVIAYLASKTFAEQAAWNYVKNNRVSKTSVGDFRTSCCLILDQRNFDVTTLLPPLVYGPVIHHVRDVSSLNTSSRDIYRLIDGSEKEVPDTSFWAFADVRDGKFPFVGADQSIKIEV